MPRSVPDDEMMENQQALDLGHPTHATEEAIRHALQKERERQEALERAAYPPGRRTRRPTPPRAP
ncbi:hypothetical protein [Chelativorans intermedius]|uniref:Uncharacterized protein n=1 Tax=Chelativorans intermedius TaxID=515947 RepID=A0ABV6D7Q5_9HYPH|nr:hypothetical protein [Chelativorans intermedius]MCT8999827.1 hypothetical protein [Chelativorans intermedius]